MQQKDNEGNFILSQREIEDETGLSRPYIRKLAKEVGHQFARNGIEIRGTLCMCTNCGCLFRKPPSRAKRAKNQFCDEYCKIAGMKGVNHPNWKEGKTAATFSTWVKNQQAYKDWQQAVFSRDNYTCQISGRTDNLDAHHILQKAEMFNPEKAFDVDNGITLNKEVHQKLHELIRDGKGFEEAVDTIRAEYEGVANVQ